MNDVAIRTEKLSKQYRIGLLQARHTTLRDQVAHNLKSLVRRNGRREPESHTWALKDVNVEIKQGEIVGIIGRNGAGKSTLLKILCRITEPTDGRAEIYGRIGSLLEVGTGFHFELTGRENVYLSGAILGMRKQEIDRKFDEIVEFSEVGKFIDTPVKHYSSGMYVRLAFAVAAHLDPEILIIDEVLSVGDLAFQRKCAERMAGLQQRNATVIVVSHNMFAIKAMCNRVVYLENGQVRACGSPAEVIPLYEGNLLDQEGHAHDTPRWAQEKIGADASQRPIRIVDTEILDENGERRTIFDYGERIGVRIAFEARELVSDANFVVAVLRGADNVNCCDYSTALDNVAVPQLSGAGHVDVWLPPVKLISDLYTLEIVVWDTKFQRLYCAQVGKSFHVRHNLLSTAFGVFHESAEWSITADSVGRS